jgi:diguanylate cyclase (GGDEF)-like protein
MSEQTRTTGRCDPLTFALAGLAAAAILLLLVAVPQWLSQQARFDVMRHQVGEIAEISASVVNGDLHRKLLNPENYTEDLYAEALAPLVRLHSSDPDIHYLYTMADQNGEAFFILDTANSPQLRTSRTLEASAYFEKFETADDDDNWLSIISSGKTYITPDFEQDDYGLFLSGHAPIYDSQGRYSGFVGVDIDLQTYMMRESRFRAIAIGTLAAAVLLSLLIGYGASLYLTAMRNRVRELYETAITDSLTGLLNRRGATEIIKPAVKKHAGRAALLVVDIEGLKMINAIRGNATGDAVLARTSQAIRETLGKGDRCARMGHEFLIYSPDCTLETAIELGRGIAGKISGRDMPLAGANYSIAIGVAIKGATNQSDFTQLYAEANHALSQAKMEGRNRVSVFEAAEAA